MDAVYSAGQLALQVFGVCLGLGIGCAVLAVIFRVFKIDC